MSDQFEIMEFLGKRRVTVGAVILFLFGVLLFLIAIDGERSVFPFAMGFIIASITYFLMQTPPVRIDFGQNSFRIDHMEEISYSEITGIDFNGSPFSTEKSAAQIELHLGDRTVVLPKRS